MTWNLNRGGSQYPTARAKFLTQLDKYDYKMLGKLDTVARVSSEMNADEIATYLQKAQDANDTLFVSQLNEDEYNGYLNDKIWDWINLRV